MQGYTPQQDPYGNPQRQDPAYVAALHAAHGSQPHHLGAGGGSYPGPPQPQQGLPLPPPPQHGGGVYSLGAPNQRMPSPLPQHAQPYPSPHSLHQHHPGAPPPLHHQPPPPQHHHPQQHSPQQQNAPEVEGAAAGTRKRKAAAITGGSAGPETSPPSHPQALASVGSTTGTQGGRDDGDDDDEKPQDGKKVPGGSEFVKKLYKILDEGNFNSTVSWGVDGTSFVVHDMNQFTTSILPQHFKHSNFASFVRQLNKYDFHKVKSTEESPSPYGDNVWQFRHPDFKAGQGENLDLIKRKPPSSKKTAAAKAQADAVAAAGAYPPAPGQPYPSPHGNGLASAYGPPGGASGGPGEAEWNGVLNQLDSLGRSQAAMQQHMSNLSADYQAVIGEMINFQRNMVAQDQLMQNLIQYLVSLEADQRGAASAQDSSFRYVPSQQAQKLITTYTEVARASYDQMADLTHRASLSGASFANMPSLPPAPPSFDQFEFAPLRDGPMPPNGSQRPLGPFDQPPRAAQPAPPPLSPRGGRTADPVPPPPTTAPARNEARPTSRTQGPPMAQYVHPAYATDPTYGATTSPSLMQQQQQQQQPSPGAAAQDPSGAPMPGSTGRRESNVPGWALPPRVLLVEDDTVCRRLSSKFLEKFGCQIDVAVDGVSAVNKMNVHKYDLVLMDIMMPNLDGVSATSLIRQFDPMTPIISMTSNSGPNDIMTYFSHGMNDVLPKPFTKENLLNMLEKHLEHLKLVQQMAEIPRALGFTDHQIQDALAHAVVFSDEDGSGSESGGGGGPGSVSGSGGTGTTGSGSGPASVSQEHRGSVFNPFSSYGLSDQDYVGMLQGIAMEKEGKRELEVVHGDGTVRFQEVVQ